MEELNITSGKVLECAIEVHKNLGPGLLENVYELCLCKELGFRKLKYKRQFSFPINYKGEYLNYDLRIDILVEEQIIIELKAIETVLPVHKAQLLSYLRLAKLKLGLLINFNVPKLVDGFQRIIN